MDEQQFTENGAPNQFGRSNPYYNKRKRRSATPWIIGITIALVVILFASTFIGIIAAIFSGSGNTAPSGLGDAYNYVGVLHIEGTISSSMDTSLLYTESSIYNQDYILTTIEEMAKDDENRGILLYINSPGGEMYAGDDVYQALMSYKEETGRPVYAYFAETAASGGYYIAMAADEIFAHRMSLTGSIGVTYGTHIDLSGLCEKLGIKTEELTSGDNKAMGSYFSPLTDEQREIYQSLLAEYEGYFIDVIEKGRGMSHEEILPLADGRVFSANQALENGLIDGISSYEEYEEKVESHLGADVSFVDLSYQGNYEDLLSSYLASLPSTEIAAVLATIKPLSGPLAYYSGH
ncbi:MAG: signal peptide peptidase SppA [Clostridia bacterium]|nr:signal peptide peptidase SppA [Clostridia bacterium]